jgi:hypothetical protein
LRLLSCRSITLKIWALKSLYVMLLLYCKS